MDKEVCGIRLLYGLFLFDVDRDIIGERYLLRDGKLYWLDSRKNNLFKNFCKDNKLRIYSGYNPNEYILGFQLEKFRSNNIASDMDPNKWITTINKFENNRGDHDKILYDIITDFHVPSDKRSEFDFISIPLYC